MTLCVKCYRHGKQILSFFSQWPLCTWRQLLCLISVFHSLDSAAPTLKHTRKYFLLQWDQVGTLLYFKINYSLVGTNPCWAHCSLQEKKKKKSSLVKSWWDYLHLKFDFGWEVMSKDKDDFSEIDKCTRSTTPKCGHKWIVEDSPKNHIHWKWEIWEAAYQGVSTSGWEGKVLSVAQSLPTSFTGMAIVRIATHCSSLLCNGHFMGFMTLLVYHFQFHFIISVSLYHFQSHLNMWTLIMI